MNCDLKARYVQEDLGQGHRLGSRALVAKVSRVWTSVQCPILGARFYPRCSPRSITGSHHRLGALRVVRRRNVDALRAGLNTTSQHLSQFNSTQKSPTHLASRAPRIPSPTTLPILGNLAPHRPSTTATTTTAPTTPSSRRNHRARRGCPNLARRLTPLALPAPHRPRHPARRHRRSRRKIPRHRPMNIHQNPRITRLIRPGELHPRRHRPRPTPTHTQLIARHIMLRAPRTSTRMQRDDLGAEEVIPGRERRRDGDVHLAAAGVEVLDAPEVVVADLAGGVLAPRGRVYLEPPRGAVGG